MPKLHRATSVFLDRYQLSPVRPDLKLLGEVCARFANLPWENLTKYVKKHRPIEGSDAQLPRRLRGLAGAEKLRLSEEVMADHLRFGAGGTCFSLTNLLRRITSDLGYRATAVMADMRHGPNVHCALRIDLDGRRFLLDPGYLVAEPVALDLRKPAAVRHPGTTLEYRPAGDREEIELHTVSERGERLFRYRLRERGVADQRFVHHWLDSFASSGMNGLHLNRITGGERLSAHNLNLRIDTGRAKTNVKLREGYVVQVSDRFGIDGELVRRAFDEWGRSRCPGP